MNQGHSGLLGSQGDTIQRAQGPQVGLIYFFHARGILITLKGGDLIRNSSTGFLCCHFVFINAWK